MLRSYLTGVIGVMAIGMAWVGVQSAWRRAFPDHTEDPDALANRMGCHGCRCTDVCAESRHAPARPKEELR